MLIHIHADCKHYSEIVRYGFCGGQASKGEFRCDNPDCRCDIFHVHGFYERKLLTFDPFSEKSMVCFKLTEELKCYVETLAILRVKCAGCGVTHGIAPVDMIPFSSFSLSAFFLLIMSVFISDNPTKQQPPVIHENPFISWHIFKRMLLVYSEYRDRMMAALRQKGLHFAAPDLPDVCLIKSYNELPPPCISYMAFLDIHGKPLFVHRRNTVSYPLRFLVQKHSD